MSIKSFCQLKNTRFFQNLHDNVTFINQIQTFTDFIGDDKMSGTNNPKIISKTKPKHYTIRLDAPVSIISNKVRQTELINSNNNKTKQLSFIRDDDAEDEDDESVDSADLIGGHKASNSVDLVKIPQSTSSERVLDHMKPSVNRNKSKDFSSDQDGLSTPNSCSDDDRLSEGLDYDEDSVKSSPQYTNNTKTHDTNKAKISSESTSQIQDSQNHKHIEGSNTNQPDNNEAKMPEENSSPTNLEQNKKESLTNTLQSRIKSFISLNRDEIHEFDKSNCDLGADPIDEKSHKSYQDLLKYFFKDACFFQIKSINHENVEICKSMGVWSTFHQNEQRLNAAFRENRSVILIFSVQQSGAFQGFARMISKSKQTSREIPWVLPERLSNKSLSGLFKVEWLCTKELPFQATHDLLNPFNDNKPVKIARDGQQLEPRIGRKLCKLFPRDSRSRILRCLSTLKRQVSQRKKTSRRYDSFYPLQDRRGFERGHMQGFTPINALKGYPENVNFMPTREPIAYGPPPAFYSNARQSGRRRSYNQFAPYELNYRQNMYPSHYGNIRSPYYMPRGMDGLPRFPLPCGHNDYVRQGQVYAQSGPGNSDNQLMSGPDLDRYHPYHRIRR